MLQFIIGIIILIISLVVKCTCTQDVEGGTTKLDNNHEYSWFDPKLFVNNTWAIGSSLSPKKWDTFSCSSNEEWQKLLDRYNKDGLCFKSDNRIMKWVKYTELPIIKETEYLRNYKVSNLYGLDAFLMTPFLRKWQEEHIQEFIPQKANIFDIGIGTGRSNHIWNMKHANVWGVEPDLSNYNVLMRKNIPCLRDAKNWGGEDKQILGWIPREEMDVVMMSYSITFFFESSQKLDTLLANIDFALKDGGVLIIIGMDGSHVNEWKGKTIDNDCFKIIKQYKKLKPFGSEISISIKSPTTLVDMQTEYLTDFNELESRLAAKKYTLVHSEHVEPPFYLAKAPSDFVKAQKLMVFRKS